MPDSRALPVFLRLQNFMSSQPEDKPIELWRNLSTAQLMAAVRRTFSIPSNVVVLLWTSPQQGEDKRWDLTDQAALDEILRFADELYVGVEVDNTLAAAEWLLRRAGFVKVEIRREGMAPKSIAVKKYTNFGELNGQVSAALELPGNQRVEMLSRNRRREEKEYLNLVSNEEDELLKKLVGGGLEGDLVVIMSCSKVK